MRAHAVISSLLQLPCSSAGWSPCTAGGRPRDTGPALGLGGWREALNPPGSACPSAPRVPHKQGGCGLHSLCRLPSSPQPSRSAVAVPSPVSVRGRAQERSPPWGQAGSRVGSTRACKMCPAGTSPRLFSVKRGDPGRGKATAPCPARSQLGAAWFGR